MIKRNNDSRLRSKTKIRKKISGTPECPRLTVYRSLDNIYAQLVDDSTGSTLVAASSLSKEVVEDLKAVKGKISKCKLVGKLVAQKAIEKSKLDEIAKSTRYDGNDNFNQYVKNQVQSYYHYGQPAPIKLFDVFSWAEFIKSLKKKKEPAFEKGTEYKYPEF